jgi:uncharacterized protein (DUF2384 family)
MREVVTDPPAGFDPAAAFAKWAQQGTAVLGWRRPIDLLDTSEGLDEVLHLLDAMEASVYL